MAKHSAVNKKAAGKRLLEKEICSFGI